MTDLLVITHSVTGITLTNYQKLVRVVVFFISKKRSQTIIKQFLVGDLHAEGQRIVLQWSATQL